MGVNKSPAEHNPAFNSSDIPPAHRCLCICTRMSSNPYRHGLLLTVNKERSKPSLPHLSS